MDEIELLAHATKFTFGDERRRLAITVERRYRRDEEKESWAVCRDSGSVLAKDGEWEYEPLPSYRDEEFLKRCRWSNRDEAIKAAQDALVIMQAAALNVSTRKIRHD